MTRDQLNQAKMKSRFNSCGTFGHGYKDHETHGLLKPGVMSTDKPIIKNPSKNGTSQPNNNVNSATVQFNMAQLSSSSSIIASTRSLNNSWNGESNFTEICPLLEDGAPYSAIEIQELCALPLPFCLHEMDPLTGSMNCLPTDYIGSMVLVRMEVLFAQFSHQCFTCPRQRPV